jgi:ABC-type Fe3+-hydroxamate transport system substrate-binding protein
MRKFWICALFLASAAMFTATPPLRANEGAGGGAAHNYTMFHGKVTAIDAANATLTLTDKNGVTQTFTIPAEAKITLNGQASTLAAIAIDMYGVVKTDNGTIIAVRIYVPKKDAPKT